MVEYVWDKKFCRAYADGLRSMVKFDHKPIAKIIFKNIEHKAGQTVVNIATGPGFLLLELAKLMESPILIGQDANADMLEITEEEGVKAGKSIKVCKCAAEALKLGDNTADVVVCKQLLHEANNPAKVIAEICRILKPGGKAFIIDFDADGSRFAAYAIRLLLWAVSGRIISGSFWKSFSAGLHGKIVQEYLIINGLKSIKYIKRGPN
jgi:ubiquinone/menaquinone biosynthesis C-methylase UbiE